MATLRMGDPSYSFMHACLCEALAGGAANTQIPRAKVRCRTSVSLQKRMHRQRRTLQLTRRTRVARSAVVPAEWWHTGARGELFQRYC